MAFPQTLNGNYQANTGFGGFRASLDPAGVITVRVRIHWEFLPGQVIGGDPVPWSQEARDAFKNAFRRNIPQTWDRKWKLRCTKAQYAGDFEIEFDIADGTQNNHDLWAVVKNQEGVSALDAGSGKLILHKTDNLMYDDKPGASKLAANRIKIQRGVYEGLQAVIDTISSITLDRGNAGGWTVSPGSQIALQQAAQQLIALQPRIGTVPILIAASSGAPGKAQALVDAVSGALDNLGVSPALFNLQTDAEKTRRKLKWPWTPNKPTATASVSLDDASWNFPYRVADHEFGHCLGLPDEYTLYSGNRINNAHQVWQALCLNAGVQANSIPANLGESNINTSIMSNGWVTCACHYVTIWDAVRTMTANPPYSVQPNEWQIVRGTETQTPA